MRSEDVFPSFAQKQLTTKPNGLEYSYYLSPGFHTAMKARADAPVLLICHGFPDHARMWAGILPALLKPSYPIVLVDILGLGKSQRPTETRFYNYRAQASCLLQILDHEEVRKPIIAIGHDWGSAIVQRFYLYHSTRCIGICLLSLAYNVPSTRAMDLGAVNSATKQTLSYPGGQWEYWLFFTRPDAPKLLADNLGRFYEAMHGVYPSPNSNEPPNPVSGQTKGRDIWMRELFCAPSSLPHDSSSEPPENRGSGSSALHDYITRSGKYQDFTVDLKPYAQDERLKDQLISQWQEGGLAGAVNYYQALRRNTNVEDERTLCPETSKDGKDYRRIAVPLLYVGCTGDWVCRTDQMKDAKDQGLLDDCILEEKIVDSGHWLLYESPSEVAEILADWLQRRFPIRP